MIEITRKIICSCDSFDLFELLNWNIRHLTPSSFKNFEEILPGPPKPCRLQPVFDVFPPPNVEANVEMKHCYPTDSFRKQMWDMRKASLKRRFWKDATTGCRLDLRVLDLIYIYIYINGRKKPHVMICSTICILQTPVSGGRICQPSWEELLKS